MKMLEICLKLVGCKSKKGLSSSSSCYLEGKNDFFCVCVCVFLFISDVITLSQRWTETFGRAQEGK